MLSKVWFAHAIYHTSKSFYACAGMCVCDSMPLLTGLKVHLKQTSVGLQVSEV